MTTDPALFETVPQEPLRKGEQVIVLTMWGPERALVLGVHCDDFPMAKLLTTSGDTISVAIARVKRDEP